MNDNETENQVIRLLSKDFQIEREHFLPVQDGTMALKNRIKKVLDHLLQADFEKLLNIMYRLDIDESKFKAVLSGELGNDVSGILAELVIERELKKIETRKRYKDD